MDEQFTEKKSAYKKHLTEMIALEREKEDGEHKKRIIEDKKYYDEIEGHIFQKMQI